MEVDVFSCASLERLMSVVRDTIGVSKNKIRETSVTQACFFWRARCWRCPAVCRRFLLNRRRAGGQFGGRHPRTLASNARAWSYSATMLTMSDVSFSSAARIAELSPISCLADVSRTLRLRKRRSANSNRHRKSCYAYCMTSHTGAIASV